MERIPLKIGITFDLRQQYLDQGYSEEETAEFDRPDTIDAIENALSALGHQPERIGNAPELMRRLVLGDRWDLVFNICEGLNGCGRESQVPAMLDVFGIPYTFSDPCTLAVCLDKGLTKCVVKAAGVPTPEYYLVRDESDVESLRDLLTIKFPLFAKPNAEGSSKGIAATSRVANFDELLSVCRELLLQYDSGVLVEQFLPGREFTVGILGSGREARCLGTMEILLSDQAEAEIYSYHNKENYEELVSYRHCHSAHDWFAQQAEMVALKAWQVLGCRDGGRVDIRFDDSDNAQFLEANPLAGLHPWHSDLPMIATAQGVQYVELIRRIVDSATSRSDRSFRRFPVPLGPASVYGLAHLTSYEGQQL